MALSLKNMVMVYIKFLKTGELIEATLMSVIIFETSPH